MNNISSFLKSAPSPNSSYYNHMNSMGSKPKLVDQRTGVFIAHRLSTIMHCNAIVVLEKGRVVEMGSHEELMDLDKVYASMWKAQQYEQDESI